MDFDTLKTKLANHLQEKLIYNADYEILKHWANNILHGESREMGDNARDNPELNKESANLIIWDFSVNYTKDIKGKLKKLGNCKDANVVSLVKPLYERWLPVSDMLIELKTFIIKGRKPSTKVSVVRTFENTGTCAVCNKNVKLDSGLIVDHGYIVRGQRMNSCFGVNYQPFEISPEGAIAYRDMCHGCAEHIKRVIDDLNNGIMKELTYRKKQIKFGESDWEAAVQSSNGELRFQLRNYESIVRQFDLKIASWKLSELPK